MINTPHTNWMGDTGMNYNHAGNVACDQSIAVHGLHSQATSILSVKLFALPSDAAKALETKQAGVLIALAELATEFDVVANRCYDLHDKRGETR